MKKSSLNWSCSPLPKSSNLQTSVRLASLFLSSTIFSLIQQLLQLSCSILWWSKRWENLCRCQRLEKHCSCCFWCWFIGTAALHLTSGKMSTTEWRRLKRPYGFCNRCKCGGILGNSFSSLISGTLWLTTKRVVAVVISVWRLTDFFPAWCYEFRAIFCYRLSFLLEVFVFFLKQWLPSKFI